MTSKNTNLGILKIPTSLIVLDIPEKSIIGAIFATVKIIDNKYPKINPTKIFKFL